MTIIEFFGTVIKPAIVKGKYLFAPEATGQILDNIFCIRDKDVNMFLYKKDSTIISIDCGYKNSLNVPNELRKFEISPDCISSIFLSHLDLDHAGGVDKSNNIFPNANIYLGSEEEKYLTKEYARKKVLGLTCRSPIQLLPGYIIVNDREIIKIGTIKVQFFIVAGHTLGHGCYLIDDKYLFTGDSLILVNGNGYSFYDLWNVNTKLNMKSLTKIKNLDAIKKSEMIFTSHSGYSNDFTKAFSHIEAVPDWREKEFRVNDNALYNPYKQL